MATFFRTKVIKDIGTQKIVVFEVPAATNATVIGLNLANTTDFAVQGSVLIKDDGSVEGFYVKDVMIPPQTAFKAMIGGEKIVLPTAHQLIVQSSATNSIDAVVSYVDIQ
jgi:hypothetical protein|tara:strand:- start:10752 stop:11081 length:330 start_codon:yes stop_codon:yes gene_type:complete